jgi:site-specific recombinase XerC
VTVPSATDTLEQERLVSLRRVDTRDLVSMVACFDKVQLETHAQCVRGVLGNRQAKSKSRGFSSTSLIHSGQWREWRQWLKNVDLLLPSPVGESLGTRRGGECSVLSKDGHCSLTRHIMY